MAKLVWLLAFGLCATAGLAQADDGWRRVHAFDNLDGGGFPSPLAAYQTSADPVSWALYGTTLDGGNCEDAPSAYVCSGVAYKLTPPGPGGLHWTFSRIFVFPVCCGENGRGGAGLVFDRAGSAYGISPGRYNFNFASPDYGSVYRLTPPRPPQYFWDYAALYKFQGGDGGCFPGGSLVSDGVGGFFGVTADVVPDPNDPNFNIDCRGTVFRLSSPAVGQSGWTASVLYRSPAPGGFSPDANILLDSAGALYGTATAPGGGAPTLYRLTPPARAGAAWSYSALAVLPGESRRPLTRDAGGNVYGVSAESSYAASLVWRASPPSSGTGAWTFAAIYRAADAAYSGISFVQAGGSAGALTGWGQISAPSGQARAVQFRLTPLASGGAPWQYTVLRTLDPGQPGHGSPQKGAPTDASGAVYSVDLYANSVFKLLPRPPGNS